MPRVALNLVNQDSLLEFFWSDATSSVFLCGPSGCKKHSLPPAVFTNIAFPLVNPVEPSLPEFYFFRDQVIPAPGVRTGDGFSIVSAFDLIHLFHQFFSPLDDTALRSCGRGGLVFPPSSLPVGFRLFTGELQGLAIDADLPRGKMPVENQDRRRISGQLLSLFAFKVCVKGKPAVNKALE